MPNPVAVGVGVGGTVLSSYFGAEGAKDAAQTSADASSQAARLQYEQYLQSRQDLSPYREVAVGKETYGDGYSSAEDAYYAANPDVLQAGMDARTHYDVYGQKEGREWFEPSYSGGSLDELSGYGPSKVDPSQYLPGTQIPQYQRSQIGNLPNIEGDIPAFDSTQFDIYKDPSYEWRKDEMQRGVRRESAGMGQVTSGNRLEKIMDRTGRMASQEYKDAYGRMLTDYGIRRENEASQYGRDVGDYNRAYSRDQDQYGRDLTAYNADVARESGMYGRGADDWTRAYGMEGDYLNRLAALSNIGQTATGSTTAAGTNYAANAGNAITAAGQAQAAGQVGSANAWAGGVGDLTSLYAMSQYGPSNYTNYGGMASDVNNMYNYSGLY